MKTAALFPFLNEDEWLHLCMKSVEPFVDKFFVVVSKRVFYSGGTAPYMLYMPYLKRLQGQFQKPVEVVVGSWIDAIPQGNDLFDRMKAEGFECVLTFDSDELADASVTQNVIDAIKAGAGNVGLPTLTYFHKPWFIIDPPERHILVIATRLTKDTKSIRVGKTFNHVPTDRLTTEKPLVYIDTPMHHFAWVRNHDDKILQKTLGINGLPTEKKTNWYHKVWKNWNRGVKDFHPLSGPFYHEVRGISILDLPPEGKQYVHENSPTIVAANGDTFWSLAEKSYGDGSLWSEIKAANPGMQEPLVGLKVSIPDMERV